MLRRWRAGPRRTPERARRARLWVSGLALIACERSDILPSPTQSVEVGSDGASRALAAPAAFDMTVSERAAVLGAVARGRDGLVLELARFDARGNQSGPSRRVRPVRAAQELSIVDTPAGLVAIWREADPGQGRARGVLIDRAGTELHFDLGAAPGAELRARGQLAVAARGAGALVLVRGAAAPCEHGLGHCFEFRFHRVSPAGAEPSGLGLLVPSPCEAHPAQLIAAPEPQAVAAERESRFHYALCSRALPAPGLTVFSIQPDRSYAVSHQAFEGCEPLGAGYFAGWPSFVAECDGSRQLARVRGEDGTLEVRSIDARGLVCRSGRPRLRLGNEWLTLDAPLARLELLLDRELSPAGARAVWTGAVLLVVEPAGAGLRLRRYACDGSALRELANPLAPG